MYFIYQMFAITKSHKASLDISLEQILELCWAFFTPSSTNYCGLKMNSTPQEPTCSNLISLKHHIYLVLQKSPTAEQKPQENIFLHRQT